MSNLFFFNDTATTEIYTLSLHDALPIWLHVYVRLQPRWDAYAVRSAAVAVARELERRRPDVLTARSEEHTSELQSRQYLVCRLLLEKKQSTTAPARRSSRCDPGYTHASW